MPGSVASGTLCISCVNNTEIYRKSGSIFKQRFYLEGQDLNPGTEAGKADWL
jgi:hypothetical protein